MISNMEVNQASADSHLPQSRDNAKPANIRDILFGAVERIIHKEHPFKSCEKTCCARNKNNMRLNKHELVSPNKAVDDFWNSDERKQLSKHHEEVSKKILKARGTYSTVSPYVKRHELIADLLGVLPLQNEKSIEKEVPNYLKSRMKHRKMYRDISDWGLSDEEEYCGGHETTGSLSDGESYQSNDHLNLLNHSKHDVMTPENLLKESLCHSLLQSKKCFETEDSYHKPSIKASSMHREEVLQYSKCGSNIKCKQTCSNSKSAGDSGLKTSNNIGQRLSHGLRYETSDNLRQGKLNTSRLKISDNSLHIGASYNKQLETSINSRQRSQDTFHSTSDNVLQTGLKHTRHRRTTHNSQIERLNNARNSSTDKLRQETVNNYVFNETKKESVQSLVKDVEGVKTDEEISDFTEQTNTNIFPSIDETIESFLESETHYIDGSRTRLSTTESIRQCDTSNDKGFDRDNEHLDEASLQCILNTLLCAQRHFKDVVPSLNPQEFRLKIENYMIEKQKNMVAGEVICTEQEATKVLLLEHIVKFFESKIIEIVKFAKSIPGFRDLIMEDQASLIKVSRIESAMVSGLPGVNTKTGVVKTDNNGELPLNLLGSVISPIFLHEFVKIGRKIETVKVTENESAILRGITLTFSDRCQLKEPEKVEKIQKKLVTCLQYVLERETTMVTSSVRMGQLFDFLTSLRNFTDVDSKMLEGCIEAYPNNHSDLVKEFLDRDTI